MIPTLDTRLESLITVMQSLIIPDLRDSLALEQARLVVGHLSLIRQQLDYSVAFEQLEWRASRQLARMLAAGAAGGPRTLAGAAAVRTALEAAPDSPPAVRLALESLNDAIDAFMRECAADATEQCKARAREHVLAHSEASAKRARCWFAALGFEPGAALPTIPDMVREFALDVGQ